MRGRKRKADDGRGGFEEPLRDGIEELLELAEQSGPPDVPENIGNLPPEGRSEPPVAQRPVQRLRTPQPLQTAEQEILERQVQGQLAGGQTEAQGAEEEGAEAVRTERAAPRAVAREEVVEDDDAELEDETEAGADDDTATARPASAPVASAEDGADASDDDRAVLPPAVQAELARLQGQVQALLQAVRPAQTPPEPPPTQELTLENVLPYRLGRDFIQAIRHGDEQQAANIMQAALASAILHARQQAEHDIQRVLEQRDPARIIAAREAMQRGEAELTQAFYRAHPDIDPQRHGRLVRILSGEVKQRLMAERGPSGFTPKEWIDETAREVRAVAGLTRRPAARGANVRPLRRPAFAETRSSGRATAAKKPLTAQEKEMLDLLRVG